MFVGQWVKWWEARCCGLLSRVLLELSINPVGNIMHRECCVTSVLRNLGLVGIRDTIQGMLNLATVNIVVVVVVTMGFSIYRLCRNRRTEPPHVRVRTARLDPVAAQSPGSR